MTGKAKMRQMKPKRAAKKRDRKASPKPRAKPPAPKVLTFDNTIERYILLVRPRPLSTKKLPWWPCTDGPTFPDYVTVRIEVYDDGDVLVDGWTNGADAAHAVPLRYLKSAQGAWCGFGSDNFDVGSRSWVFHAKKVR